MILYLYGTLKMHTICCLSWIRTIHFSGLYWCKEFIIPIDLKLGDDEDEPCDVYVSKHLLAGQYGRFPGPVPDLSHGTCCSKTGLTICPSAYVSATCICCCHNARDHIKIVSPSVCVWGQDTRFPFLLWVLAMSFAV